MRSKLGTPLSSQATASPSMMQERERSRAKDSTINRKRYDDGFRVVAQKDGAKVRLYSRPGNDLAR
jgi:ATP-dependent DNA ligase